MVEAGLPRTFRLYAELDLGEKSGAGNGSISYGLDNAMDQTFTVWNGTIVGPPNTKFDNRILFLSITCGPDYPEKAMEVKFNSKVNLPSVNQQNGRVEPSKFHLFKNWNRETTMEKMLQGLFDEMKANKNLAQPADGDIY